MYNEIINFLDHKRLKEGLALLKEFATSVNDWEIRGKIEDLQTNYEYMLTYAAQGQDDPGRNSFFIQLLNRSYELADDIKFAQRMNTGYSDLADVYRNSSRQPLKSFKALQEELLQLNIEQGIVSSDETTDFSNHSAFPIHSTFDDYLFNKIVTSKRWNEAVYSDVYKLVYKGMSPFDLEVMISAVTLSLLQYFDWYKFYFLINIYLDKEYLSIKCRALVGIALTYYYHESRIQLYPTDEKIVLDFLLDSTTVSNELHLIQQAFLLTRETEKIDKKMREEIIPEMMKNPYLKGQNNKIEEFDLNEIEQKNPEWQEEMDRITEHIQELGELQREGADTYMSTFAMLKNYNFFKTTAHWFYPFDIHVSAIKDIFNEKNIQDKSILNVMLQSPAFCNSDKYSFCMALNEIPSQQMQMLGGNIQGKEELLNVQLGAPQSITPEEKYKIAYRQYIQDLYRFFKLWNYRNQQHDIFTDPLDLWNIGDLKKSMCTQLNVRETADYLLAKGYYKEATELLEYIIKQAPSDTELLQKSGFAHLKMKHYQEADSKFSSAFILNPKDVWNIKQLAYCEKKLGNIQKALELLEMASDFDPENLSLSLQIGQCLICLNRYEEAIKHFFKVEYLGKSPVNARRAIAWCYFMTKKYAEAKRFYQKIIQEAEPTINDWLNYGHANLAEGNLKEAVHCYKEVSQQCASHDEFIQLFRGDVDILKKAAVEETTLYIVQELV